MSCGSEPEVEEIDKEKLVTMQSLDLKIRNSTNGKLAYVFETPLMERYELAAEPFMEFRKGIKVVSYNDSTQMQEATLIADYAKYIEPQQLWEARGNVVATNAKGQKLETEQLFWDEKSDRIYSVVKSVVTEGEDDITVGDGFETNSRFDDYKVSNPRGHITVDTETKSDSTALEQPESLEVPSLEPGARSGSLLPQNTRPAGSLRRDSALIRTQEEIVDPVVPREASPAE